MKVMYALALLSIAAVLAGCSSHVKAAETVTSAASTAPTAKPFPTGLAVPTGPLGGNYCAQAAAYYITSPGKITVQVLEPGPADVAVQVVDAANNIIGNGTVMISDVMNGGQTDIPVADVSKIAGVSLAVGGSYSGSCVLQKLGT